MYILIDYRNDNRWTVYIHILPQNVATSHEFDMYYVGITKRLPNERWMNGKGYKHNLWFYHNIEKYGWDTFQHEIVATHLTEKEANDLERALIKAYKMLNPKCLFNVTDGGDGCTGLSGGKSKSSKPVICLNTLGKYVSAKDAAKRNNLQHSKLCACCRGERFSCGKDENGKKLKWMYIDEYEKLSQEEVEKLLYETAYRDMYFVRSTNTKVINLETKMVFNSAKEANIYYGYNEKNTSIGCVLRGVYNKAYGYHWMLYEDYIKKYGEVEGLELDSSGSFFVNNLKEVL